MDHHLLYLNERTYQRPCGVRSLEQWIYKSDSHPWWLSSLDRCRVSHRTLAMTVLSIDHVQIAMPVGEEEKARKFYMNLLGFMEIPKPAKLATRGGAWFQSNNVQLHLGVEADFKPARKAHPALIVSDLDSLITKVQNAGYETDTSQPPLDGYKRAHVFDPFGNRIELMEKL